MSAPDGKDLLATLIRLLAEQEGVKITFELAYPEGYAGHHDINKRIIHKEK